MNETSEMVVSLRPFTAHAGLVAHRESLQPYLLVKEEA
jgi:hypothetical protein